MKITLTSDGWEETSLMLRSILVPLTQALNLFFVEQSYGCPLDFMAVVVAVDPDLNENEKQAKGYNKVGSSKHPITNERSKHISIGLPIDPAAILARSEDENRVAICDALLARLEQPIARVPKDFNYAKFVSDLQIRLEILKKADYA